MLQTPVIFDAPLHVGQIMIDPHGEVYVVSHIYTSEHPSEIEIEQNSILVKMYLLNHQDKE